jgi:hypothetical protein
VKTLLCYQCGTSVSGRPVNRKHWKNADAFDWRNFCTVACAEAWFHGVLIESTKLDAWCIRFECLGGDVRDLLIPDLLVPAFHAPRVPTYPTAVTLAATKGIEAEFVSVVHRPVRIKSDGYFSVVNQVEVLVKVSGTVIQSAALSRDVEFAEEIAKGLAFRNAVQRICFPGRRAASSQTYGRDIES